MDQLTKKLNFTKSWDFGCKRSINYKSLQGLLYLKYKSFENCFWIGWNWSQWKWDSIFPFFFTRACQNRQQKWSWSWSSLKEALAPKNVCIVNPYKEALNLIIAFINNLRKQLWSVNLDISRSFAPQNGFGFGPTIVGGKYGRSKDAASVFFAQLRSELLSN